MSEIVVDPRLRETLLDSLKIKRCHGQDLYLDRAPDGRCALVFFGQKDMSPGHAYWAARFALVDDKHRRLQEFGWNFSPGAGGLSVWSPDSAYAAVAISGGVLVWRKAGRRFAAIRALNSLSNFKLSWEGSQLEIGDFAYTRVERGRADPRQDKIGTALIGMDQLEFYVHDYLPTVNAMLDRQPILTPDLFAA